MKCEVQGCDVGWELLIEGTKLCDLHWQMWFEGHDEDPKACLEKVLRGEDVPERRVSRKETQ